MSENRSKIGINLASYLPKAAWDALAAILAAHTAGYQFLQALPLRSMYRLYRGDIEAQLMQTLPFTYLEEAWNPATSLSQVLWGMVRRQPTTPTLVDYAFFPSQDESTRLVERLADLSHTPFANPRIIAHRFGQYAAALVEVHPGLWMTVDEIVTMAKVHALDRPLVIDTAHLRTPASPFWKAQRPTYIVGDTLLGDWREALPRLLPYATAIHVSPLRTTHELEACVFGQRTELADMLHVVRESGWIGDLIVEATLGMRGLDFAYLCSILADFRLWIFEQMK